MRLPYSSHETRPQEILFNIVLYLFIVFAFASGVLSTDVNDSKTNNVEDAKPLQTPPSINHDTVSTSDRVVNKVTDAVPSVCEALKQLTDIQGFDEALKKRYCDKGCSYDDDINCKVKSPAKVDVIKWADKHIKIIEDARVNGEFDISDNELNEVINFERLMDYISFFFPLVVVIVLSAANITIHPPNSYINVLLLIVSLLWLITTQRWTVAVPSSIVMVGASMTSKQSNIPFGILLVSFSTLIISLGGIYVDDFTLGSVLLGSLVLGLLYFAMRMNESKHSNDILIAIFAILIVVMVSPLYTNFIGNRSRNNIVAVVINYLAGVTFPIGTKTYFIQNAVKASGMLYRYLCKYHGGTPETFYWLLLGSVLGLLLPRGLIGLAVVRKASKERLVPAMAFMLGLYLYCIDVVTSPLHMIGFVFHNNPGGARAYFYHGAVTMFTLIELFFARELFFIRIIVWLVDMMFVKNDYRYAQRFLHFDVELQDFVFPKKGAIPAFDSMHMTQIVNATKRVVVDGKAGVALLISNGMNVALLTVRHVISNKEFPITFDGKEFKQYDMKLIGESDDPIVVVEGSVNDCTSVRLSNVVRHEVSNLKLLVMVSPNGMLTPINKFEVVGGDILATLNLRSGDSGSPIIGVLGDGSLRYVGAVSRGSFEEGTGNYITLAIQKVSRGSPGLNAVQVPMPTLSIPGNEIQDMVNQVLADKRNLPKLPDNASKGQKQQRKKVLEQSRSALDMLLMSKCFDDSTRDKIDAAYEEDKPIVFNEGRMSKFHGLGYHH